MKKQWSVLALLLLLMLFSAPSPQKEERPLFVPGEVVVKFKTRAPQPSATAFTPIKSELQVFVVKYDSGEDLMRIIERLKADPNVEYAEPNYLYYAAAMPNDPEFHRLWGLHNTGQTGGRPDIDIDAPEAWETSTGDTSIIVGVIDTGVDYKHPDLAANLWTNLGEDAWADPNDSNTGNRIDDDNNGYIDDWRGWDFANNDNDPFDDNGHGTHLAGILGAVGNDGVGVVGVNWKVKIMPLKFLAGDGSGSTAAAIAAVAYANSFGVNVTNNSWGGGGSSQALKDAISAAHQANALFVATAGGSGANNDATPVYPANYDVPNIIVATAVDHNGTLGGGSSGGMCGCGKVEALPRYNYGATTVDLAAPGQDIYSAAPNNTYSVLSGASMATAHVSGVAALTLARFPTLTDVQLKDRLMRTVMPLSSLRGKTVTGGMVNAANALRN